MSGSNNNNSGNSQMDRIENTLNSLVLTFTEQITEIGDSQITLTQQITEIGDSQIALTEQMTEIDTKMKKMDGNIKDMELAIDIGFRSIAVWKKGILFFLTLGLVSTCILLLVPSSAFVVGVSSIALLAILDLVDFSLFSYITLKCKICMANAVKISTSYIYLLAVHTACIFCATGSFISSYRILIGANGDAIATRTLFKIFIVTVAITMCAAGFLYVAQKKYVEQLKAEVKTGKSIPLSISSQSKSSQSKSSQSIETNN